VPAGHLLGDLPAKTDAMIGAAVMIHNSGSNS
jgi:hypothetical protein